MPHRRVSTTKWFLGGRGGLQFSCWGELVDIPLAPSLGLDLNMLLRLVTTLISRLCPERLPLGAKHSPLLSQKVPGVSGNLAQEW